MLFSAQYLLSKKNEELNLTKIIECLQPPKTSKYFMEEAINANYSNPTQYIIYLMALELEPLELYCKSQNNHKQVEYIQKIKGNLMSLSIEAPDTFSDVKLTLDTSMIIFNTENIKELTKTSDFELKDIRSYNNNPTTLYIKISEAGVTANGTFIRVFFEILANFITSQEKKEAKKNPPLTIIADEFVKFGKIEKTAQLPETGRSKRANVIFISQTFAQLKRVYGNEGANELKANCAVLLKYLLLTIKNWLKTCQK